MGLLKQFFTTAYPFEPEEEDLSKLEFRVRACFAVAAAATWGGLFWYGFDEYMLPGGSSYHFILSKFFIAAFLLIAFFVFKGAVISWKITSGSLTLLFLVAMLYLATSDFSFPSLVAFAGTLLLLFFTGRKGWA